RPELLQEPDVVFSKQPQVIDLVLEHGDTFYAHPKGKSGVFLGVNVTIFQYIGIDHPRTADLHPAASFTDIAALAATELARNIYFGARFGKGKIRRPEPYLRVLPKHLFGKMIEGLLQI